MAINRRNFLKGIVGAVGLVFLAALSAGSIFKWLQRKLSSSGYTMNPSQKESSSNIEIAFGDQPLKLPYLGDRVRVLKPNPYNVLSNPEAAMEKALDEPIGVSELFLGLKPTDKVAICISDSTRTFDQPSMVKALICFLTEKKSHPEENIFFVVGNGNHAILPVKKLGLVPDIENSFRFINVNGKDKSAFVKIGRTSSMNKYLAHVLHSETTRTIEDASHSVLSTLWDIACLDFDRVWRGANGGPVLRLLMSALAAGGAEVWMEKNVAEADYVISIGQIKPHPLSGFSGGAKGVMPGATARLTNIQNHLLQAHPSVDLGKVEGNIIREGIEEGVGILKNVSIFNVVLNGEGKPAYYVAGDFIKAHRKGVEAARKISEVPAERTPLVIAANGTQSKLDLYQFSKSASTTGKAVDKGGIIILCGELPGGIGENMAVNGSFAVKEVLYHHGLARKIPRHVEFYCVSPNAKRAARGTFYKPFESIGDALSHAWKKLGEHCPVTVIPDTDYVIPMSK